MKKIIIDSAYIVKETNIFLDVRTASNIRLAYAKSAGEVVIENNSDQDITLFSIGGVTIDNAHGLVIEPNARVELYGNLTEWQVTNEDSDATSSTAEIAALQTKVSGLNQEDKLLGIVVANADGSNLTEADYIALPATKNSDGKLYVYFEE